MTARVSALAVPVTGEPVLAVALHVQHEPTASSAMPASAPASEQVELATGVFTPTGRSVGALRETLVVTPQAGADGVLTYDVLQRIPARPGRYELRVGLRHQERGQTGSVYTDVDVPDYRKIPFAVSDIGVYAPQGRAALAGSLEDVLLAPPTARRDFDRSERATAFLRLYQMSGSPPTAATLSVRIVDALDRRRYGQDASFEAGAFTPTGTADYVVNLPLDELETGAYLLTVEAKAGSRSARRDLRFEVR
jgi:hypothetical protein